MVEQIQQAAVRACKGELGSPRILFTLVLSAAVLLVLGVGGSLIASGQLPASLSTLVSTSLMAGVIIANSVQITWEATH